MSPLKSAQRAQIDQIVEQVKQEHRKIVHQIRWELGNDWTGDPCLYFRVVMRDSATRGNRLHRATSTVQKALLDRLNPLELDLFCYFNYRSESEQAELREPSWA
jgi:hypothetical protein